MSEITDRLKEVETGLTSLVVITKECNKNVNRMLEKHENIIQGEGGNPGLKTKIDRLEQSEKKRAWHFRTIWGGMVAMVMKVVYDMFGTK